MRQVVSPYEPREQFLSFHYRPSRWACIVAHRRAGKTVACINELLYRAVHTKKSRARYAYVAPFYNQAKQIAWDYLKYYGEGMITNISETELQIETFNGSKIRLYGADNPNALRGIYLDGVILDEYGDMRPSVWGSVIRPMLADRRGWAVFIGTPKGHNEFYKIYKRSREDSDWYSLILRASDTGTISQVELDDARKTMSENEYEQEFECSFEAAVPGAVYAKWLERVESGGRMKEDLYDPSLPIHTGWDLGYEDATAIWWFQLTKNELRLVDYYESNLEDIIHYCEILKSKPYNYEKSKHFVPHDAANKLLAAGGRSIVERAYKEGGIKMHVVQATTVQNSIEAARKTLECSWFDRKACEAGIESLRHYHYEFDGERNIYKTKPRHDWSSHACDAFEIVARVWRNPVQSQKGEKPRFLHDLTAKDLFWPEETKKFTGYKKI